MSYRERRNRKDSRGKTPEQIRRGLAAHEARYERTIADMAEGLRESDLPLSTAGYLAGLRVILEGSAFL